MRWEMWAYAGLFAIALAMRFYDLGSRAVHHDESLHGVFSFNLAEGLGYIHNPLMHGPFLFHSTAASFFLFGDNEVTLRLTEALFGSVLVFVPLLLRPRLGNIGALIVAAMLTFSPTLLYFSRFARNDIYMAVFTLALVGVVWRYMDERKAKWLYWLAALMALGFVTKETQFLVVFLVALGLLAFAWRDIGEFVWGHRRLSEFRAPAVALLVISLFTLPQIGAVTALFQSIFGLTLAASESVAQTRPGLSTGSPEGAGVAVAVGITIVLLVVSVAMGLLWNRRTWLGMMLIFWPIFFLLFTTFGTNLNGFGTGVWQSFGYWIGQQEVSRGTQPWYYYFIVVSVYEFLPWTIAIGAAFYYAVKGDGFTRFLIFWAVATFAMYSWAGEKMPWLTVNIAVPLIVLAGKAMGDAVTSFEWQGALRRGGFLIYAMAPVFLIVLWRVIFFRFADEGAAEFLEFWAMLAIMGFIVFGFWKLMSRVGRRQSWAISLSVVVALMFGLTVRAGWVATYVNSDVPNEMLIYTQTSPEVPRLAREIALAGTLTGQNRGISVTVDSADGFTWPWAWYFRSYTNVDYPYYDRTGQLEAPPPSSVVVVNARNNGVVEETLLDGEFNTPRRFPHRQWFPEAYRDLTAGDFFSTVINRDRWRDSIDFFLQRKLPGQSEIGGVDSYVYFRNDIPLSVVE